jgi:hypothetical protein
MSKDGVRTVRVDTRFDAYRNFLSDDWGERVLAIAAPAAKLSELTLDVMIEWRAAAYTMSLPASILDHVKAYHDSYVNTGEINTTFLRLAETIPTILARRVPELTSKPRLIRRLQEETVKIGAEFEAARRGGSVQFPLEDTWNAYVEHHVYQLSLWGSQRIAYVSIYNSYENFLVRAVSIAQATDRCRTTDKDFKERLAASFGDKLLATCWTSNALNVVRLARHSLSHAGGRLTDKLARQQHGFVVADGRIQVMPDNTKALFALLKDCVYLLAEQAVTMPEFL